MLRISVLTDRDKRACVVSSASIAFASTPLSHHALIDALGNEMRFAVANMLATPRAMISRAASTLNVSCFGCFVPRIANFLRLAFVARERRTQHLLLAIRLLIVTLNDATQLGLSGLFMDARHDQRPCLTPTTWLPSNIKPFG